jgi:hypothetical protein
MRRLQLEDDGNLSLVEFIGENIPPYDILSHMWSQTDPGISFATFVPGGCTSQPKYKRSYDKIRRCGEQAAKDRLRYSWDGICCINKKSSAEPSEAIDSMFAWCHHANICYAYLANVHTS